MELKIKDHEGLVRDASTGAILNTSPQDLEIFRRRRAKILKERDRDNEIRTMRNEIKDLRSLIVEIYGKVVNP
jgi:hypothetical protein